VTTDLQQFRYDNIVRRVGGIIGPGSKVKEAIPELFPMIDLERIPAELLWLAGWRMAWGGINAVGAAGEQPSTQLLNPAGSGKMITVTDFNVSSNASAVVNWTTTNVVFPTTVSPELFRDTRRGASAKPIGQIRTFSNPGFTVASNITRIIASVPFHFRDDNAVAVLFPGTALEIGSQTAAGTLTVNFVWRERDFIQSEVTGI